MYDIESIVSIMLGSRLITNFVVEFGVCVPYSIRYAHIRFMIQICL